VKVAVEICVVVICCVTVDASWVEIKVEAACVVVIVEACCVLIIVVGAVWVCVSVAVFVDANCVDTSVETIVVGAV
jgi:hypothetical protein